MDSKIDWTLLLRYLNGETTPEEERKIANWMNSDDVNREFMQLLEIIWQMEPDQNKKIDADKSWNRFVEKFGIDSESKKQPVTIPRDLNKIRERELEYKKSRNKFSRWIGLVGVAASIIISVLLFTQFFKGNHVSDSTPIAEEIEYRELRTEKGQRTRILLSDGSVIYLNGDSYLRIPETFNEDAIRKVYLEGEAFFEIPKRTDVTFQVITAESIATVLGTKFNVLSYPEDEDVTVVVAEGKVSLGYLNKPSLDSIIIEKNQKGVIGKDEIPTVTDVENLLIYHGWTDGELVFEQEALLQMISKLERWYNIEIELVDVDNQLAEKRLTASFSQNQPVDDVLQSISIALDLQVRETNASKNKYQFFSQP